MSCFCKGICEMNQEHIDFYAIKQVRYELGMKSCKQCDKSWLTDDIRCHCCNNVLRGHSRQMKRVSVC